MWQCYRISTFIPFENHWSHFRIDPNLPFFCFKLTPILATNSTSWFPPRDSVKILIKFEFQIHWNPSHFALLQKLLGGIPFLQTPIKINSRLFPSPLFFVIFRLSNLNLVFWFEELYENQVSFPAYFPPPNCLQFIYYFFIVRVCQTWKTRVFFRQRSIFRSSLLFCLTLNSMFVQSGVVLDVGGWDDFNEAPLKVIHGKAE